MTPALIPHKLSNLFTFGIVAAILIVMSLLSACHRGSGGSGEPNHWTWISGSNLIDQMGVYGTQGTPSVENTPGARNGGVSWTDANGHLWLFGGSAFMGAGYSDLWKFDGTQWAWVSGSKIEGYGPNYGKQGVADAGNTPGGRSGAAKWVDRNGNIWLFGGADLSNPGYYFNDLWKFDGTLWTWVSGSQYTNRVSVYGTQGIADASNTPGARAFAVSWTDNSGNLWLFGGDCHDSASSTAWGAKNDAWKFDGTLWTWMSGSQHTDQVDVYGTQGTPAATNMPGGRHSATSWKDTSGNVWIFGGIRSGLPFEVGERNDLWKFDGTLWTWIGGYKVPRQKGVYGSLGVEDPGNVPGTRWSATGWIDKAGNLWLFGGDGYDSQGISGQLNDIWKFNGTNWIWMGGSNAINQRGIYGTANDDVPGARANATGWADNNGDLWLFGGIGYDGKLNDLWRYHP
ncbi:MAG: kelch repeat-containing protein [Pseudomonadota bacterium]